MPDMNAESSSSYSALERFLIWFLIPLVFTAVLLGVLLTIFDYDIKSGIQKALHSMPLVGSVVPAPEEKTPSTVSSSAGTKTEQGVKSRDEEIERLNAKVAELETALLKSDQVTQQKDQELKDIQAKNTELEEKLQDKTQTDEEYKTKIQQLASLYGKMTPSKAAPIMENLRLKEMVLVFSMMKPEERGAILEKMDPKIAAEASISLKDLVPAKDLEIAALQERLAFNAAAAPASGAQKVSNEDLGQTFGNMVPKSAATVLLEMQTTNPDKVFAILSAMDNAARSRVMSALSDLSKAAAASIAARLAQ